jgi:methionine aminopeptidase
LYGFPASVCVAVNDEVVHGIPGKRTLRNGDIIKADTGASSMAGTAMRRLRSRLAR